MKEYKSHTVNGKNIQDHRSVMEELLGEKLPPDIVVHHINGNKTDNRPENLEIMTRAEHTRLHATGAKQSPEKLEKLSTYRKGKANPTVRVLTDEQVREIIYALAEKESISSLAKKYHVAASVIRNIWDGKTYADVTGSMPKELFPLPDAKKRGPSKTRKLSIDDVTGIRIRLENESISSLAKRYAVSPDVIRRIRDGETYTDIPWPEKVAVFQKVTDDLQYLADIMLTGPLPDADDGFDMLDEKSAETILSEAVEKALIQKYKLLPTHQSRLLYVMMRRALKGDAEMTLMLFELSSYRDAVMNIIDDASQITAVMREK